MTRYTPPLATRNPTGKNHVFIVSGGRTGTTFFGHKLSHVIKDCASVHEPDILYGFSKRSWTNIKTFGLWHMIIGRYFGLTGVRNLMAKKLSGEWDTSHLEASILRHRAKYYAKFNQSLIVEAYGKWGFLLPELQAVFPKAKFIGIARDPRDWVQSWLNYGARYDAQDPVERAGKKRMSPSMVGDVKTEKLWPYMSPFEKLCWNWNYTYTQIHNFMNAHPQSYLMKFEDLFSDDPSHMVNMLEFCVDFDTKTYTYDLSELKQSTPLNGSKPHKKGKWSTWNAEDAQRLETFCGPLMRDLGYGFEPEWLSLLGESSHHSSPRREPDERLILSA